MSKKLPLDSSVEAEYEDGFVLSETEQDDVALYGEGNTLTDILNKRIEAEHGPMIRFSCFWENRRYDIDWTLLPDNARPIRFRHGYSAMHVETGIIESGYSGVDFGYQYNDQEGHNQQEILKLRVEE